MMPMTPMGAGMSSAVMANMMQGRMGMQPPVQGMAQMQPPVSGMAQMLNNAHTKTDTHTKDQNQEAKDVASGSTPTADVLHL